mmetsp:Transcript_137754/g.343829  ORF Transcript_137754/g.343829 Transcript_137754/m.343829 type:complete len:301 (-) Transcript_137754:1001-1903(-)
MILPFHRHGVTAAADLVTWTTRRQARVIWRELGGWHGPPTRTSQVGKAEVILIEVHCEALRLLAVSHAELALGLPRCADPCRSWGIIWAGFEHEGGARSLRTIPLRALPNLAPPAPSFGHVSAHEFLVVKTCRIQIVFRPTPMHERLTSPRRMWCRRFHSAAQISRESLLRVSWHRLSLINMYDRRGHGLTVERVRKSWFPMGFCWMAGLCTPWDSVVVDIMADLSGCMNLRWSTDGARTIAMIMPFSWHRVVRHEGGFCSTTFTQSCSPVCKSSAAGWLGLTTAGVSCFFRSPLVKPIG